MTEPNPLAPVGRAARAAGRSIAHLSTATKNQVLYAIAESLRAETSGLVAANAQDVAAAQEQGLAPALVDRLTLTPPRLTAMADDLDRVADLPDPVGQTFDERTLPNGLRLSKRRVPLGVIAVVYEARPNVTIDVAGLALKTGNAVILRGGKEALHSNRALAELVRRALATAGLPVDAVQFIADTDRARLVDLMQLSDDIDMLIPRGGASLHQFCREHSRIPVITGGVGICHLYVDSSADLDAALDVIENAKVQRPSVCNALDTTLVHRDVAAAFLPRLVARLAADGVALRADPAALGFLAADPRVVPAGPADFDTEWMSLVLGLKVVEGLAQAIDHINAHSQSHSDGILTRDPEHARQFIEEVDSAAVYVNASTRFTDGSQFGLGAEVAISTQRLHARGPMGLQELTTYKWVGIGDYHIRP
ncbi:MAG: glutamate-5-semialdehyde dehydrogenase [Anaerolineae bacterium]